MNKTLTKTPSPAVKDKVPQVADLLNRIKSSAVQELADVRVAGEVSQVRQSDSGHEYFLLGEGQTQIKCVLFADKARHLNFKLKDGWHIIVSGQMVMDKKTHHPQLIIDKVEPTGMSVMQLALTQLKERFQGGEGLESVPERPLEPSAPALAGGAILPLTATVLHKPQTQEANEAVAQTEKLGVARLSIISNTVLIISKLAVGFITGSVSVISEGIHSGMDLIAAVIAYFSVRAAAVPADSEHKFGHGKIENLSGYIEASLIFLASILIIHEAINKIVEGTPVEFLGLGVLVMGLSIVLNWIVSKKLMAIARKYHSAALEADALHLTTDIYTSVGVMIGLILVQLSSIQIIDPIVAILVAMLIIHAAYELSKRSVRDLCDVKLTDSEETTIRRILDEHNTQFVDYHHMRTRRAGNTCFIDFHLIVKKQSYIDAGHKLSKHLEADLSRAFTVTQVLIQVEPCDENCSFCPKKDACQPREK